MRILFGVHHFPPHYQGGAEKIAFLTAKSLAARGHEILLVAVERVDYPGPSQVYWEEEIFNGIRTRRLFYDGKNTFAPSEKEFDNPHTRLAIEDAIRSFNPQIFYLIGGYLLSGSVLEAAHDHNLPIILKITDLWFCCPRITMLRTDGTISGLPIRARRCARCLGEVQRRFRIPGKIVPWLMDFYWGMQQEVINIFEKRERFLKKVLQYPEVIISESRFLREMYIEYGVDPSKIIHSRQGKDFSYLSPTDIEKTTSRQLRLAYFGQIANHKGVHILIKAVKQIKNENLALRIYGDETAFPKYVKKIQSLAADDPRITFCQPYRSLQEQTKLLRDIDLIVVPSIWYENSPNVVLEAQGHHTPILASDFAGLREMVNHGENGLLFNMGDADDLAEKIMTLLENPNLLEHLKSNSGNSIRPIDDEMDELESIFMRYANK